MIKCIFCLCIILSSSACAQPGSSVDDTSHEVLYPFRNKYGKFGYANENLHIRIQPQYKSASLFTKQGFAVVTDSLNKEGVINQDSQFVIRADYPPKSIHLYELEDFTLAEVRKKFHSLLRFWEWGFLPGFNLSGGGNDKRLFDTKVERLEKTVLILGHKKKKVTSERISVSSYKNDNFDIRTLDSNQVTINGTLYNIDKKGAHPIANGITDQLTEHTFSQQDNKILHIVNRNGKRLRKKGYLLQDKIEFVIESKRIDKELVQHENYRIASAYKNDKGEVFIYPDFSKPLPRAIHAKLPTNSGDYTVSDILQTAWMIASVPNSDYFAFISYFKNDDFILFLDTQGNWHQDLPPEILFTFVQRGGNIMWPTKEHYMTQEQIPEGWKMDRISHLSDSSLFHITLEGDKGVRQGIWDFNKRQWLIAPNNYEVYSLGDNNMKWRFQPEKNGLWGIMDHKGTVLIEPSYYSIHTDGWVEHRENGKYISFYLHLPTLTEFREK